MTFVLLLASGIGVYGSLFAKPAPKPPVNPPVNWNHPAPPQAAKAAVVCGMTLLPADPNTDRSIAKSAPDAKPFPMRTLEPPICRR